MALNEQQVRDILARHEGGALSSQIESEFGISQSTVSRILTGKIYPEITGGINRSKGHEAVVERTKFRVAYIASRLEQGERSKARIGAELRISRQAVVKLIAKYLTPKGA